VEKREKRMPIEIQQQAVDLDEEVLGVAAQAVGPWQRHGSRLRPQRSKPPPGQIRAGRDSSLGGWGGGGGGGGGAPPPPPTS
jgi:hypothetical protein